MKTLFSKLGLRKEDEMQTAISTKAIRISWFYLICMLGGTYIYEYVTHGKVGFIPGFVLPSAMSIFFIIQLCYTQRMTSDENGKSHFINFKVIALSVLIFIILFGLVLFIVVPDLFFYE